MTRSLGLSWAALVGLTLVLTGAMRLLHLPAALMLGPMISAIAIAILRPGARLPKGATVLAQAVLGCLIAHALSPHLLADLAPRWPLMLGMNLVMILAIAGLGLLTARFGWLPGTAGIWGMSPGGAGAMVLLSEAYGADKRIVAVMQYVRLLCAALAVVAIGSLLGQPHVGPPAIALPGGPSTPWLAPIDWAGLAMTIALSAAAVGASMRWGKPALVLLIPVFGGIAVQIAHWPAPAVPPIVSAIAFALIGWHVGLSFTRASLMHTARLAPRILACSVAILILCAALAVVLAWMGGVSFLTAYMALNPGGTDVVLAMAANIAVDLPLILAMQLTRLVLVIAVAPGLGRLASGHHLKAVDQPQDPAAKLADDVDSVL